MLLKNFLLFLVLLWSQFLFTQQTNQPTRDTLNIVQLNEVQLEGIRATDLTPFTFTNVAKEDIRPRNLGQDIPILLNFLPSVVTTSDAGNGIGYTSMRVRGSDARSINVTINGIPYNDAESQGTFWVDLPDFASSIESIQLQRGVGTSTNGTAAFGASLNIETSGISMQPYAEIANSIGSFNTLKNTLNFSSGLLNNHFELSGRLSRIESDGYIERASSDLDSYFLQLAYQNQKTLIRLLLFGGHETTHQSWYGIDVKTLNKNRRYNPAGEIYDDAGNLTGFYDTQVDDYTQDHFQFLLNQQIKNNWSMRFAFNYTYGRGYYQEYNDIYANQNISFGDNIYFSYLQVPEFTLGQEQINLTEDITRKWLDNHFYVSTLGLNYIRDNIRLNVGGLLSHYSGDHFGELLWGHQLGAIEPNHRFYENLGLKYEQSIFGKLNYLFNDKLSFYIDLQWRRIQYEVEGQAAGPETFEVDDSFSFFNPKFGLSYSISNQSEFYFSFAKAQREPNRTDFENGNPVPEELDNYELGFRSFTNRAQWQINLYYMDYTNQLILSGQLDEVGAPIRENIGKSRRLGIELESSLALSNRIHWQTTITLSSNKNIDYFFQRDGKLENLGNTNISYSPNLIGSNILQYALTKDASINLLSKYVSSQYMGNIDSEISKLSGYFVNDLNFVYNLKPKKVLQEFELSLMINNLFNRKYVSNGYFYTYDVVSSSSVLGIFTEEQSFYYPQAQANWLLGIRISL